MSDSPDDARPNQIELPPEIASLRAQADRLHAALGPHIDAVIAPVMENCRRALDALAVDHTQLADRTDLDLDGDSRWAARWTLCGAAIAYARALVDLTAAGHVDTTLATSRTLTETLGILGVVNDDEEDAGSVFEDWLADAEIRPKKVRAAAERQAQRIQAAAAAQGVTLDVDGVKAQVEAIYALQSDVSHLRRSALRGFTSSTLRRTLYGPHPDPTQRAAGAMSTLLAVEGAIVGVGDALAAFFGGPYYAERIKPIQNGLMLSAAPLMLVVDERDGQ